MSFCFLPSPRFHVVSFPASKCSPSVHPKLLTGTGSIRTISRIPTARDGGGDGMGDIWVTRPNDRALLGHTSNVVCGPSNPLILCFPLFFLFFFTLNSHSLLLFLSPLYLPGWWHKANPSQRLNSKKPCPSINPCAYPCSQGPPACRLEHAVVYACMCAQHG